jgi:hypothetical protein
MNHEARSTDDIDHGNNLLHRCSSLALSLLNESKIKLCGYGVITRRWECAGNECGGNVVGDIEPAAAAPRARRDKRPHNSSTIIRPFLFGFWSRKDQQTVMASLVAYTFEIIIIPSQLHLYLTVKSFAINGERIEL